MSDDEKPPMPPLVSQPHGGALWRGGVPGNNGGRPTGAIRQKARESLVSLMPKLDTIAKARKSKDSDKIAAIGLLAKIGMSTTIGLEDVKAALRETTQLIRETLPPEEAEPLLERIRQVWNRL